MECMQTPADRLTWENDRGGIQIDGDQYRCRIYRLSDGWHMDVVGEGLYRHMEAPSHKMLWSWAMYNA